MSGPALRRILHASTVLLAFLPRLATWRTMQLVVSCLFGVAALLEFARLVSPGFNRIVIRTIPAYRDTEARRLSGGFWLAFGYVLAVWLPWVGPAAASAGIAVAALSDPAASLVGTSFSRTPGKSLIGSAAAVTAGATALAVLGFPLRTVLVGALVGAAIERVPAPLDDNACIAPAVALAASALA